MTKKIYFGEEMTKGLLTGVRKAAKTVGSTIGPAGRTVLCDREYGSPLITRDGITVLREIQLEDKLEALGAKLVTDASDAANSIAGDGSSTTAILSAAIIEEGLKATASGVNPIKVKNGINKAVADLSKSLNDSATEVETKDQIKQVATISANNDTVIGDLIAEAIEKVGNDGVITLGDSKTAETYIDFCEGMQTDKGWISPYFSTDHENLTVDYENALILITNKKLSATNDLLPTLDRARQAGRPLLIIAPDVDGDLLTTLIVNNMRGIIQACAVKAPGFGDRQKDMLEDLAVLCGTQVIDEQLGYNFEALTLDNLGSADSVKVTKDSTTIAGGHGTAAEIEGRKARLKKDIEDATSDYDKEKIQERLARLAGGVAVIKVGATTEVESKEARYRVEDSVNAVRAAIDGGILPGGGTSLVQIAKKLKEQNVIPTDPEEAVGYNIVMTAIEKPLWQIAENAGAAGDVVVDKVKNAPDGVGYNALTNTYVSMVEAGIIDPAKVTRVALENAASVASLVLTSGASIITIPEKKDPNNPQ